MMRASHLAWLAITAFAALAVFMVAYQVRHLEEEHHRLSRTIAEHQESIHVLHAEWSYLNRPERLEALAFEHLGLVPVAGRQMTTLDAVPARAPAVEQPLLDLRPEPSPGSPGRLITITGEAP